MDNEKLNETELKGEKKMDNEKLNETELKEKEVEEVDGGYYFLARCVYKDDGSLQKCPSPNQGGFEVCNLCHLLNK